MAKVLFVCLHNAGRSQISQALFQRAAGDRHEARSAGTTPADLPAAATRLYGFGGAGSRLAA